MMIAQPRIPLMHVWILVWAIVGIILLYGLICFVQALRTPPDAWMETNRACGFPKRRK